jgi:hypothetical protein
MFGINKLKAYVQSIDLFAEDTRNKVSAVEEKQKEIVDSMEEAISFLNKLASITGRADGSAILQLAKVEEAIKIVASAVDDIEAKVVITNARIDDESEAMTLLAGSALKDFGHVGEEFGKDRDRINDLEDQADCAEDAAFYINEHYDKCYLPALIQALLDHLKLEVKLVEDDGPSDNLVVVKRPAPKRRKTAKKPTKKTAKKTAKK